MEHSPEIAEEIIRRVALLKENDRYVRVARRKIAGLSVILALFAVALVLYGTSNGAVLMPDQARAGMTMLKGAEIGGYVLVGVIGFSLGIAVSLIAGKYGKKKAPHGSKSDKI